MKMCNTDFKIFSVPYVLNGELESGLKKYLQDYEKDGYKVENVIAIRDTQNPHEDYGRVTTFMAALSKKGWKNIMADLIKSAIYYLFKSSSITSFSRYS